MFVEKASYWAWATPSISELEKRFRERANEASRQPESELRTPAELLSRLWERR